MDTVARRRRNLRKAIDALIESGKFKSDAAFCEHYDLSTSHISQMINGHGSFGERAARNLEKKVGWPNGYLDLENQEDQSPIVSESNVGPTKNNLRTIPLLDYVQAGLFHDVGYDGINPIGESYTTYQGYKPECVFSLKVEGNSMSPEFKAGDEIFVDASLEPKPGSLVIAQEVQHGIARTTFKKYRVIGINEFGVDVVELVPLNPDYPTYNSTQIEISIIGVVVRHNREITH
ncbi:S24 family peptidase [Acinetobacter pittii]|uniref:LexA family protein n=1 Tax=Acinetobacter pittii TaxID=48296 RepID=UPI001E5C01FD|nr:S24 family peptidase [Acinetobacter pittii]MDP7845775.1 S24 family peptidase [Acinetobacter pittii]MDP7869959.1 S24 family peptidase [Acinetobacter pittii]UFN54559.1 S24 family peptidase [Acinetobacter pittii]